MNVLWSVLLLFTGFAFSQVVNNVRLVDHRSYILDVLTKTMQHVETRGWSTLRANDFTIDLNEDIFGVQVEGTAEFKNGFVVSIQHLDVIEFSVLQVWSFNNTDNTATVQLRASMRMLDITIGYDVHAQLLDGDHTYTAEMTYPSMQFDFTIAKNIYTDVLSTTVVGSFVRTTNLPVFMPRDNITNVIRAMYDWNSTFEGVTSWAGNIFAPIALDVATNEVEFPRICYNCAVV